MTHPPSPIAPSPVAPRAASSPNAAGGEVGLAQGKLPEPITLGLHGMTCLSCARAVENMLNETPGVRAAKVNFAANSVDLQLDARLGRRLEDVSADTYTTLSARVRALGYTLVTPSSDGAAVARRQWRGWLIRLGVTAALTALILLIEGLRPHGQAGSNGQYGSMWGGLSWLLSAVALGVGGQPFLQGAWTQARRAEVSMDALVALGTLGALLLSGLQLLLPVLGLAPIRTGFHDESAAVILLFILAGRVLEERAKRQSGRALEALQALEPTTARRLEPSGASTEVPLSALVVGDVVEVLPGATIPVDGVIHQGQSEVDEALLTGEWQALPKGPRDGVVAGTKNLTGRVLVRTTARAEHTLLAGMLQRVRRAQESRLPAQRLADRVSAVFVPVVLGLAALTLLGWGLLAGDWWAGAVYALTVLVVSCPCALGLATPVAVQVAIGRAAREGLVVRDAEALTAAANIRAIAFDKTGTLTQGRPSVVQAQWLAELAPEVQQRWLALARGAAEGSRHPASRALAEWVEAQGIGQRTPMDVTETPGQGLEARAATGQRLRMGRPEWVGMSSETTGAETTSGSLLSLAGDDRPLLLLHLADAPKADAAAVLGQLSAEGIAVAMLTGDNAGAAADLARAVGLAPDAVHAGLTPEAKAQHLRALRLAHGPVALVGDGVNDAEALVGADLSVALAGGAQAALASAQVSLLGAHLAPLLRLLRLGRATRAVVAQNLVWAFGYNLLMLPVATGVLGALGWPLVIDPRWAGAAMAVSSLAVIGNSLRLAGLRLR